MRLAAYVCRLCRRPLDTDDPTWVRDDGHDVHRCCERGGRAVLARTPERELALEDARKADAAAQRQITREMTDLRRQETINSLNRSLAKG